MAGTKVNKEQLYPLIYNTEDNDLSKLFLMLRNVNLSDSDISALFHKKQNLIEGLSFGSLTNLQRLLLGFYLHFYAFSKSRDIAVDERLRKVREKLKLDDNFTFNLTKVFKQLNLKTLIDDRSPIEAIFEPSMVMINFSQKIVLKLNEEGICTVKERLTGLSSKDYEHEFDRNALETLKNTAGLETIIKKFYQYGLERMMKIRYTGSNIKVTNKNLPMVHKALLTACSILDIQKIPDLYIDTGFINASTMGVEQPIVVLTTGCIGLLTYDELLFVIGHELGHIKSQHVLYHQIGQVLPYIGEIIGSVTFGIGNLVSSALQIALYNWYRKSEFTADRAGLLCCQNIDAAVSAMIKIAGMPPKYYNSINTNDFIEQAKEFRGLDEDNIDKIAKLLSIMHQDHPWTVLRGYEMNKWIEDGNYHRVLDKYNRRIPLNASNYANM